MHFANGWHAAHWLVAGVVTARKGQGVHAVELGARERARGQILHHVALLLFLHKDLPRHHVLIVHLQAARLCIGDFIGGYFVEASAFDVFWRQMRKVGHVARAVYVGDGVNGFASGKAACDFGGLVLAHAEADKVCPCAFDDAWQHGFCPVVVVRKAAQRCL